VGRFAIVVSRFNPSITSRLLDGAVQTLQSHGVASEGIDVVWVPGAFEIPLVAGHLADSGRHLAVLCLGAVIRGETSHDQHINRAVSNALVEIGVHYGIPVLFGILTCNTLEQAEARSGGAAGSHGKDQPDSRVGNKGIECAEAALEMVDLMSRLRR
jgi:6,7-dimethyl-8-ribityllumazine synthase